MQNTIRSKAVFEGRGLHSGKPVGLSVLPAPENHGIYFRRLDLGVDDGLIAARWDCVVQSRLCTLLRNEADVSVSTVEHLMAAFAGCGIHNAIVEIDGPEVPILDGSSMPFVQGFLKVGIIAQNAPAKIIRVNEVVEYCEGDATARLEPANGMEIDFQIQFEDQAIGFQHKSLNLANGAFVRELSNSRTFCRKSDVEYMRAHGLALGGTLENAVVFAEGRILTPGGLRHIDEPVRHKMLDAMGDLYLAGGSFLGRYVGIRAGHALTNKLLRKLFSQKNAYSLIECDESMVHNLPGVGLVHSDIPAVA